MQRLQPTHPLGACPQLRRVHFLSPQNHAWVASYLAYLRARQYGGGAGPCSAPSNVSPCSARGPRQATLYQDLTQTTPADIDAWIAAAFQQGLAPGTIVTYRHGLPGLLWLPVQPRGLAQLPIRLPRHHILLPTPPGDGGSRDRRVLSRDRCAGRPHDVSVVLRCGLRVSEVSHVRWTAID